MSSPELSCDLADEALQDCASGGDTNNSSLTDMQWLGSMQAAGLASSPGALSTSTAGASVTTVGDLNGTVNGNGRDRPLGPQRKSSTSAFDPYAHFCEEDSMAYQKDSTMKPPYSYAQIIVFSINASPNKRLALSDIYDWVAKRFPYYPANSRSAWKNSIRHNLSLQKCFSKQARAPDDPGKGAYWLVVPENMETEKASSVCASPGGSGQRTALRSSRGSTGRASRSPSPYRPQLEFQQRSPLNMQRSQTIPTRRTPSSPFELAPSIALTPDGSLQDQVFSNSHPHFLMPPGRQSVGSALGGMDLASSFSGETNPHRLSVPTSLELARARCGSDPGNLFLLSRAEGDSFSDSLTIGTSSVSLNAPIGFSDGSCSGSLQSVGPTLAHRMPLRSSAHDLGALENELHVPPMLSDRNARTSYPTGSSPSTSLSGDSLRSPQTSLDHSDEGRLLDNNGGLSPEMDSFLDELVNTQDHAGYLAPAQVPSAEEIMREMMNESKYTLQQDIESACPGLIPIQQHQHQLALQQGALAAAANIYSNLLRPDEPVFPNANASFSSPSQQQLMVERRSPLRPSSVSPHPVFQFEFPAQPPATPDPSVSSETTSTSGTAPAAQPTGQQCNLSETFLMTSLADRPQLGTGGVQGPAPKRQLVSQVAFNSS